MFLGSDWLGKSDGSVESGGPGDFDIFEENIDSNDSHAKFILGVKNIFFHMGGGNIWSIISLNFDFLFVFCFV